MWILTSGEVDVQSKDTAKRYAEPAELVLGRTPIREEPLTAHERSESSP
jgi:hypothetical protein